MALRPNRLRLALCGVSVASAAFGVSAFLLAADNAFVAGLGVHVGLAPLGWLLCVAALIAGLLLLLFFAAFGLLLISKAAARGCLDQ